MATNKEVRYTLGMALITNKKAYLDYEILETFSAGVELLGLEVKALRAGRGSLEGARVIVRGGEAFLLGMNIPPYQPNNMAGGAAGYDPDRTRRLLLTKREIAQIAKAEEQKGLTVIPISLYNKSGKIKADIAVVKGKKKYDKRESIKKRDTEREMAREARSRH